MMSDGMTRYDMALRYDMTSLPVENGKQISTYAEFEYGYANPRGSS